MISGNWSWVVALGLAVLPPGAAAVAADPPGYQGSTSGTAGRPPVSPPPPAECGVLNSQAVGRGFIGGSPPYPGGNAVVTTTGSMAGGATGVGTGSTSWAQPSTQSPTGSPDGPSTTPGGPPTTGTGTGLEQ